MTGLYNYGARYYDPGLSVWLGVDPLADHPNQVDKSPYAYAWNNPVKYTDPDGRCPICPYLVGAGLGAAIDYGSQVTANLIQGKGASSFTDVDGTSILVSAGAGATGVGLMQGIKNFGRVAAVTSEIIGDGVISATSQVINEGEVNMGNVALDAVIGQGARRTAGAKVKEKAANSKTGKALQTDVNTQQNVARGKSRQQGVKKTDANVSGAQNKLDNYVTGQGAVGSGAAAGSVRKAVQQTTNQKKEREY